MDKCKVGIIIQARMGSSRLPKKVMLKLGGKSVISNIIERISNIYLNGFDFYIIVASSSNKENDVLEDHVKNQLNTLIYRGDEQNVFSRFQEIQNNNKFDYIVRLTGDNPAVHYQQIKETLQYIVKKDLDYVYSGGFPLGLNVEVLKANLIENVNSSDLTMEEKEHVTKLFRTGNYNISTCILNPENIYPNIRLTLDEEADLVMFKVLFEQFENNKFTINDILEIRKEKPWIFEINKSIHQKIDFSTEYKALSKNIFEKDGFSIVPIRFDDRLDIMKWRNEQIYHLRQDKPLTETDQENYFTKVVSQLFEEEKPQQILFSFLKEDECIGYGGLVHINWVDKNAEISFIMDTSLESEYFYENWVNYLGLIEQVAFKELDLHKIYTYAFDLRPHLYVALENAGFEREAILKEHCFFEEEFKNVIIHSKYSPYSLRPSNIDDLRLYFDWANDKVVRQNAFNSNPIEWKNHVGWFSRKINSKRDKLFVLEYQGTPIGQIRFDFQLEENSFYIDYSLDSNFRGRGLGKILLKQGINQMKGARLIAEVKISNQKSRLVFEKIGFQKHRESLDVIKFVYE